MDRKYNLKLDLQFRCNNQKMRFDIHDNLTSDFFIRVTSGGRLVDLEKAIVILAVIKPNQTAQSQFLEVTEGKVYADLNPNMKDQVGIYKAKALLIYEDERVTTDIFQYEVTEDNILNQLENDMQPTAEFAMLQQMLSRLSTIEITEEDRVINEANRILAEEERKKTESNRVEAENIRSHEEADRAKYEATRQSNETSRIKKEDVRVQSENARINNENARINNEITRVQAEQERSNNYKFMTEDEQRRKEEANSHKTAELARVQAEKDRVSEEAKRRTVEEARVLAENARNSKENERTASEISRVQAENQRVLNENGRKENEINRTTSENARLLAEQQRVAEHKDREKFMESFESKLQQMEADYNEAVANMTNGNESATNSEIVLARKGKTSLREKIDEVDSQIKETKNDIKNNYAKKSEVGTPLIANTISEMIDTTKIYVYIGSESGYINGNWYSYNGKSWVSGGVYNSQGIGDKEILNKHLSDEVKNEMYGYLNINKIPSSECADAFPSAGNNVISAVKLYINTEEIFDTIKIYCAKRETQVIDNIELTLCKYNVNCKFEPSDADVIYKTTINPLLSDTFKIYSDSTDNTEVRNNYKNSYITFKLPNIISNNYGETVELIVRSTTIAKCLPILALDNSCTGYDVFDKYMNGGGAIANYSLMKPIISIHKTSEARNEIENIKNEVNEIKNNSNKYKNKKANFLGDSITQGVGTTKTYVDIIKDKLELSVARNYGVSGTTITTNSHIPNSFNERYSSMDDDADIIFVLGGTNDYGCNYNNMDLVPLGENGTTDETTFYGALRSLIRGLFVKYTDKTIIFITPPQRVYTKLMDKTNTKEYKLLDYVNAIKDVCCEYSIPVIDLYSNGIKKPVGDIKTLYFDDDIHPNDKGHEIIAEKILDYLLK